MPSRPEAIQISLENKYRRGLVPGHPPNELAFDVREDVRGREALLVSVPGVDQVFIAQVIDLHIGLNAPLIVSHRGIAAFPFFQRPNVVCQPTMKEGCTVFAQGTESSTVAEIGEAYRFVKPTTLD